MGIETALIVSAVAAAGSSIMSGVQQRKWGKYENQQAQADAAAAEGAARIEAQRIRNLGQREKSSARAAIAANGVKVDEGLGDTIQTDITQRSEQDALTTILNAGYQGNQLRRAGSIAKAKGDQAFAGSVLRAGGQLASAYGGWKAQAGSPASIAGLGDWSGSSGGFA